MKALSAIKKEILELSHDRTVLLVLLVFPVFVMVFMGSSFRSMEISGLPIGITGATNTTFASMLFSGLGESQAFKLRAFDTEAAAMEEFRNGKLRAVIVVPEDFDQALLGGRGAEITVMVDNSDLALEQAVVMAMSSVIEASSTNITRSYISAAWTDMMELNDSASSLATDIASTRMGMEETKIRLAAMKEGISETDMGGLESSMAQAAAETGRLQQVLDSQKAVLANATETNLAALDESRAFMQNASSVLSESISSVETAHGSLSEQAVELNRTIEELGTAVFGLEAIKDTTTDITAKAALELNIDALQSLQESAQKQLDATEVQIAELETLNATLQSFARQLAEHSVRIEEAQATANNTAAMEAALGEASASIRAMNASFSSAQVQIAELKGLMTDVNATMAGIDSTLDGALEQTAAVDELIGSLQQTVATQTGRDPGIIASPLSVRVENQYERGSFVDFLMPQIIALSLLLSCFLLGAISLVREKQRKTIMRALMVSGGMANLVIGKVVTLVLLSFGQVAVILLVALAFFGVAPPQDMSMLLAGTAVSAMVLSSIGVLVGFYAKSESMAIQSCLILAIPMLFLGNIIFSPDLLPAYTQLLQQLLPLAHVTNIFKVVLITSGDPTGDMVALLSYFVVLAALMAYLVMKRSDISSYM